MTTEPDSPSTTNPSEIDSSLVVDSYARLLADMRAPMGMASQGDCDAWADRLEKLSAASVQVWQPIESAPKDGTHILAYGKGYGQYTHVTWWVPHIAAKCGERYGWHYPQNGWMEPTHWMPLPLSPQGESHGR